MDVLDFASIMIISGIVLFIKCRKYVHLKKCIMQNVEELIEVKHTISLSSSGKVALQNVIPNVSYFISITDTK